MKLRTPKAQSRRPIRPEAPLPTQHAHAAMQRDPQLQAPQPARRRRTRRIVLGLLALTLIAALGVGGWLAFATVGGVQAAKITRDATPTIQIDVDNALFGVRATNVRVEVDGREDNAARVTTRGARSVSVTTHELSEGAHTIRVRIESVGLFRRTLSTSTSLTVDTVAPRGRLTQPATSRSASTYVAAGVAPVTQRPAQLKIDAEAGSRIELRSSAPGFEAQQLAADELGAGGLWKVALPEGAQTLTLAVRDEAGNTTTTERRVLVDTTGPTLRGAIPTVVTSNTLGLRMTVRDTHGVQLRVLMNGNEVQDALQRTVVTPAPNPAAGGGGNGTGAGAAGADGASGDDGDDTAAPIAASYQVVLPEGVYEGRHTLQLIASDSLGAQTKLTKKVIVDSTETLDGAAGAKPGARGADVLELQRALIAKRPELRASLAKEVAAHLYGGQTTAAVKAFQSSKGIDADGVAGADTLAALTLAITVNRATHTLTLTRAGRVVKTWNVAVGAPKYPTPSGSFTIVNMQKDPTWTPPDSEWAKDAKPIGPGPKNPLGTRWMGIGGSVGIHGTIDPASIGFSVSHGCIRMQIADVEELFDMVRVGTPVTIV